jgi:pimeloyl-ACP methyl ester carboxylesterase
LRFFEKKYSVAKADKMKIYLIPGLGYDGRIFERLDFKGHDVKRLRWIEPKEKEAIHDYAARLFEDLPANEEDIILIGHSLGAIMSQEIAAQKKIKKIILLSSIQSRNELPMLFKLVKPFRFYLFFTKEIAINTVKYWGKNHGFSSKKEQALFKSMVGQHSNNYLQWALKALSEWTKPSVPLTTEIFQIHGTNDKTFPIELVENPNVVIENGTHIMVYKQPQKINEIILGQLNIT